MTKAERIYERIGAGYGFNGSKEDALNIIDEIINSEELKLTNDVSMTDLRNFCGESVIFNTGYTQVHTLNGNIHIEVDDLIVKNTDGTFSVFKNP